MDFHKSRKIVSSVKEKLLEQLESSGTNRHADYTFIVHQSQELSTLQWRRDELSAVVKPFPV